MLKGDLSDKLFYLASPYSHASPLVREQRYMQALEVGADLIDAGLHLIEPIAMSHQTAKTFGLPVEYTFWQKRDRLFIDRCDAVLVLGLPGWEESVGISDEVDYAHRTGKPVYFLKIGEAPHYNIDIYTVSAPIHQTSQVSRFGQLIRCKCLDCAAEKAAKGTE